MPKNWFKVNQIKLVNTDRYANATNPGDVVKVKRYSDISIAGTIKVGGELKTIKGIYTVGIGAISPFSIQFSGIVAMANNGIVTGAWHQFKPPMPSLRFGILMGGPIPNGNGKITELNGSPINDGNTYYGWRQNAGMYTAGGAGSSETKPYVFEDPNTGLITKSWFRPEPSIGQPWYLTVEHVQFPLILGINSNGWTTGLTPSDGLEPPQFVGNSKGLPEEGGSMIPGTFAQSTQASGWPENSYTNFSMIMKISRTGGTENGFEKTGYTVSNNHFTIDA